MVRAATLETGRARLAVLAAAALLLASLLSMVGGVAAPSPALAVSNSNCNSAINPIGADGVTVSFTNANGNIGSAGGQATTWYDPNDGKFYGQAVDGAASGTSTIVEVRVTYGGSNGTDPWCIFTGTVVQTGGGYNLRDATLLFVDELPATDATSYTFTSTFDLASFGITDATGSVCVASRISSRQGGGGAPKGSACLTVATHTVTGQPTPTPSDRKSTRLNSSHT